MRALRLAAGLAVLLLMSGCVMVTTEAEAPSRTAPPSGATVTPPSSTAPPSSEPTQPTIDLVVTTAVIFGTHIEWRNAAGAVVDSLSFHNEQDAFFSTFVAHFGAADESFDQGACSLLHYGYEVYVIHEADEWPIKVLFKVQELNGIRIESTRGVSVGEDATILVDSTPPELKLDRGMGMGTYVIYDASGVGGEPPIPYGAVASVHDGLLFAIDAPSHLTKQDGYCY